jgi:hypothetical protein
MTSPNWLALAERAESGEGAGIDLDTDVCVAAKSWPQGFQMSNNGMSWQRYNGTCDVFEFWVAPDYTTSLDAVTDLVERMLPGGSWFVGRGRTRPDEPLGGARVFADEAGDDCIGEAEAHTPARALLAAFCRAMHAQGESNG